MPIGEGDSTFWEHLQELRRYLLRYVLFFVVLWIVAFYYGELIFDRVFMVFLNPDFITYRIFSELTYFLGLDTQQGIIVQFSIINTDLPGQFMAHLGISALLAFIVSFPLLIFQLWRFIKPALYDQEIRIIRRSAFSIMILFFTGVLFAYFIITPLSVLFLGNYRLSNAIPNLITLRSFFSVFLTLHIFTGLLFLLPPLIVILVRLGIVNPWKLKKIRKHVIVAILIVSAVITPTTDPFTMTVVALPIFFLFELSIIWSKKTLRHAQNHQA